MLRMLFIVDDFTIIGGFNIIMPKITSKLKGIQLWIVILRLSKKKSLGLRIYCGKSDDVLCIKYLKNW